MRERNPFIVDGVMKKKDLELVLRDPKFPQDFIPQVMQIDVPNSFTHEILLTGSNLSVSR